MIAWKAFHDREEQLLAGEVNIAELSSIPEVVDAINKKLGTDWVCAYPCDGEIQILKRFAK